MLGRGACTEKVEEWLRQAAPVPGSIGFAIGRSIWWDAVQGYLDGSLYRAQARDQVAEIYLHCVRIYEQQAVCWGGPYSQLGTATGFVTANR